MVGSRAGFGALPGGQENSPEPSTGDGESSGDPVRGIVWGSSWVTAQGPGLMDAALRTSVEHSGPRQKPSSFFLRPWFPGPTWPPPVHWTVGRGSG